MPEEREAQSGKKDFLRLSTNKMIYASLTSNKGTNWLTVMRQYLQQHRGIISRVVLQRHGAVRNYFVEVENERKLTLLQLTWPGTCRVYANAENTPFEDAAL